MIKICLTLTISLHLVAGVYQTLKYKRFPQAASIDDIGCALEKYDAEFARGVAVDSGSGACNTLSESWFSNQTQEENHVYFSLYLMENVFETTKARIWNLPTALSFGSTITGYVRTGQVSSYGDFTVNLQSEDGSVTCLHMNVRFWHNRVVFNSFQGGWGYEIFDSNPFTQSYKTYKIDFRITAQAIEISVDDALFLSFQHRISIVECAQVKYGSQVVDLHRLQYYYPV